MTKLRGTFLKPTFIVGDFNIPFCMTDKISRPKYEKNIKGLSNTSKQLDLFSIYRTLHWTIA